MRAALAWLLTGLLSIVAYVVLFMASFLPDRQKPPTRYSVSAVPNADFRLASLLITIGSDESAEKIEVPLTAKGIDRLVMELAIQRCRLNSPS
ncbi:MAG: hypothetical protein JJ864_08430 [Rhizobiaceae bacterium]|nr:hypothetical protein [Rhizobiaceae bacterium]